MVRTKKEPIRVGVNLLKQLSTTFYPNSRMIFDELVTNSRDAMATKVWINISKDSIIFEDNGEGMSADELVKFFYISHTTKPLNPIRKYRGIKRHIIGKFGIGKLSMYQICKTFEITTWKEGIESTARFNFEEIERKKFIDELYLNVASKDIGARKTGTKIILTDLRRDISDTEIRRGLQRTMPLTPDFKIYVNSDNPLFPYKIASGNEYKINEPIDGLGQVNGKIVYTTNPIRDEAGIYVRVLGRVVNENNPRIIEFKNLTHAHSLAPRIYGDLSIDALNDAIQSNRGGFVSDHPKYLIFLHWLKRKLNGLNEQENKRFISEKRENEVNTVPKSVASLLNKASESFGRNREIIKKIQPQVTKIKLKKELTKEELGRNNLDEDKSFLLNGTRFLVDVKLLGVGMPECVYYATAKKFVINSQHPMYIEARRQGCLEFHSLKSILMALALASSHSIKEFVDLYNELAFTCLNEDNPNIPKKRMIMV